MNSLQLVADQMFIVESVTSYLPFHDNMLFLSSIANNSETFGEDLCVQCGGTLDTRVIVTKKPVAVEQGDGILLFSDTFLRSVDDADNATNLKKHFKFNGNSRHLDWFWQRMYKRDFNPSLTLKSISRNQLIRTKLKKKKKHAKIVYNPDKKVLVYTRKPEIHTHRKPESTLHWDAKKSKEMSGIWKEKYMKEWKSVHKVMFSEKQFSNLEHDVDVQLSVSTESKVARNDLNDYYTLRNIMIVIVYHYSYADRKAFGNAKHCWNMYDVNLSNLKIESFNLDNIDFLMNKCDILTAYPYTVIEKSIEYLCDGDDECKQEIKHVKLKSNWLKRDESYDMFCNQNEEEKSVHESYANRTYGLIGPRYDVPTACFAATWRIYQDPKIEILELVEFGDTRKENKFSRFAVCKVKCPGVLYAMLLDRFVDVKWVYDYFQGNTEYDPTRTRLFGKMIWTWMNKFTFFIELRVE